MIGPASTWRIMRASRDLNEAAHTLRAVAIRALWRPRRLRQGGPQAMIGPVPVVGHCALPSWPWNPATQTKSRLPTPARPIASLPRPCPATRHWSWAAAASPRACSWAPASTRTSSRCARPTRPAAPSASRWPCGGWTSAAAPARCSTSSTGGASPCCPTPPAASTRPTRCAPAAWPGRPWTPTS